MYEKKVDYCEMYDNGNITDNSLQFADKGPRIEWMLLDGALLYELIHDEVIKYMNDTGNYNYIVVIGKDVLIRSGLRGRMPTYRTRFSVDGVMYLYIHDFKGILVLGQQEVS
jgi:hypothetical protein